MTWFIIGFTNKSIDNRLSKKMGDTLRMLTAFLFVIACCLLYYLVWCMDHYDDGDDE